MLDIKLNIDFSQLKNKNILITQEIEGTVDFVPNKTVSKNELVKILYITLEDKGYTLVEENNILRVIKFSFQIFLS